MNDKLDFKAFDDGGSDQLMRETMEGHRIEPRSGIWKGISRKLLWRELIHLNFTNLSPKFWLAGAVGLLLVSTTFYFAIPGSENETASTEPAGQVTPVTYSSMKSSTGPSAGLVPSRLNQKSVEDVISEKHLSKASPMQKSSKTGSESGQDRIANSPYLQQKVNGALLAETRLSSEGMDLEESAVSIDAGLESFNSISRLDPYGATMLPVTPEVDTIITISNAAGIVKFRKSELSTTRFFSANLGVTPEMAFYSVPEVYSKTNVWLNGGVAFHFSRFSIASGLGIGYVYDEGKYLTEYKSKDSIGYFTGVTSYTVGVNNEIIYTTNTVNVYDSLQHLADYRTKNRYSYLQVPLLFGYRFFESGKVSLTFQAGPAISFLLGSRKSDPVIEYQNARLIRVDDNTPSRIHTNWQIWANLYFEMRVNKKISIYLEPSFKYYLNPMVSQENVNYKAPWTIGLGVGLQFNFGQKKTRP